MLLSEETLDLDLGTRAESMITEMVKSHNPKVISFGPDLSCIRIGPRVFVKEKTGKYVDLNNLELMTEESSPYFERVELQKSSLVLASRTKLSAIIPTHDRKQKPVVGKVNEKPDADATSKEETNNISPDESNDKVSSDKPSLSKDQANAPNDGEADDESATSSSIMDSSAWNSAEESWSEASSEADENVDPAIAILESSEDESSEAKESETDSENESKSSSKDDASDGPVATQGGLLDDSDYDPGEQNLDWLDDIDSYDGDYESDLNAGYEANDDGDGWSSEGEAILRSYGRSRAKRHGPKGQQGVLMVYDLNNGHPVQLFKFSHLLTTVLDNSPPAIHPTKPLVVWPLSGGDILFADYRANSYFIRKFKPSTRKGMYLYLSVHSQRLSNKHQSQPRIRQMPLLAMWEVPAYCISRIPNPANNEEGTQKRHYSRNLTISIHINPPSLSTKNHTKSPLTNPPRKNLPGQAALPSHPHPNHLVTRSRLYLKQQPLQQFIPLSS